MLYLHLGFNKTGTSSVQSFLRTNAEALAQRGVLYPTAGLEHRLGHHHIADALLAKKALPEFADIRAAAERGTVVISSERLSQCEPAEVRAALGPAQILCYRRDFMADPLSRYAQHTKHGSTCGSFDEEFARKAVVFLPARALAPWIAEFGSVRLRSLSPCCLTGGDLAEDFCSAIGLDLIEGLERTTARNLSPGWMPLEALRAFSSGLIQAGAEPELVGRFVGGPLRRGAEKAAVQHALNERGLYLSAEQIERQLERDDHDRAQLAGSGADVVTVAAAPPPARDFMPDAPHIPPEHLRLLLAAMLRKVRPAERRRAA